MMKNFTAILKINYQNPQNKKYEFQWEGETLRSDTEELGLVIPAEDEIEVGLTIKQVSEDTVTILKIEDSSQEDIEIADNAQKELDDYAADYAKMCIPVTPQEIINTIPISVGNN